MKKTYMNPSIEEYNINGLNLLAGSEIPTGQPGSANDAEGRGLGYDDWDDEEDEEETSPWKR